MHAKYRDTSWQVSSGNAGPMTYINAKWGWRGKSEDIPSLSPSAPGWWSHSQKSSWQQRESRQLADFRGRGELGAFCAWVSTPHWVCAVHLRGGCSWPSAATRSIVTYLLINSSNVLSSLKIAFTWLRRPGKAEMPSPWSSSPRNTHRLWWLPLWWF